MTIDEATLEAAMFGLADEGYCSTCDAITGDNVEPDARGYTCPCCGEPTLMGLEEALVAGRIEVAS